MEKKKSAPKKTTKVKTSSANATGTTYLRGTETIQLIDGDFTPQDANDLLLELVNHKINFHQLRSFSLEERFGTAGEHTLSRLVQLRKDRERLQAIFDFAAKKGYTLNVQSKIEISVAK